MALKRYNLNELVEKCEDLFYSYMVEGKTFYYPLPTFSEELPTECDKKYPNPAYILHNSYLITKKLNQERIENYGLQKQTLRDKSYLNLIKQQITYLQDENKILTNLNMELQKKIYKSSGKLKHSRSSILFPLNKLINSLYDDMWLEVLFYDDVCTPMGKIAELLSLPKEKQKEFLRANTEVTHLGLLLNYPSSPRVIGIKGESVDSSSSLPCKYADFKNLKLSDLDEILNNDLRQLLQSKIDLDKENLKFLAEEKIRGDIYQLYYRDNPRNYYTSGFYIRYVCSSTARVYYNQLNLRNLSISTYFDGNNYNSYLKAWWNITHLGARIEGNPVISC